VSEDGRDVDVTLFPSWLEGTTSKPVEKSWDGLFCSCFPVTTLLAGRYWKEGRNEREEDRGGEDDFKWTKGKMEQTWFELRVGSFVMPRTRAALLHSARAGKGRR